MLGVIIGALAIIGVIVAVIVSIVNTPDNLRGFYGGMFWTIALIAIVGIVVLSVIGVL